ncbi:hypothetical protein FHW67_002806 [Herbaspirillum sp. Sphag1AN]|nr:hypothetical protein [Herbaspirillum sp. Sphag1AN]MBB3246706.1 hypothetical protein [Herbaspirillum sp. Sphag64]
MPAFIAGEAALASPCLIFSNDAFLLSQYQIFNLPARLIAQQTG